jgi:hypothetical protein
MMQMKKWPEGSFVERWAITSVQMLLWAIPEDDRITVLMSLLGNELVEQRDVELNSTLDIFVNGVEMMRRDREHHVR